MENSLFIFDIDGTLTQSETSHVVSFVDGMKDLGIQVPLTNPEIYPHVTDSAISKWHFENARGKAPTVHDMQIIEERVMHHYKSKPAANQVDGALEFLHEVINAGLPYCIATGSFHSLALEKLNKANFPFDINLLATAGDGDSRESILRIGMMRARQYFDLSGDREIVSFGDRIWDLKTAQNLNVNFVGIGHKIDYLRENGAQHCFKDYSSLDCQSVIDLFR